MKIQKLIKFTDPCTFEPTMLVTFEIPYKFTYTVNESKECEKFGKELLMAIGDYIPKRISGVKIYQATDPVFTVRYTIIPSLFNSIPSMKVNDSIVSFELQCASIKCDSIENLQSQFEETEGKDCDIFILSVDTQTVCIPDTRELSLIYMIRYASVTAEFRQKHGLNECVRLY